MAEGHTLPLCLQLRFPRESYLTTVSTQEESRGATYLSLVDTEGTQLARRGRGTGMMEAWHPPAPTDLSESRPQVNKGRCSTALPLSPAPQWSKESAVFTAAGWRWRDPNPFPCLFEVLGAER